MTTNSKGTLKVISHPGKAKASVKIVPVAASTKGEKGLETLSPEAPKGIQASTTASAFSFDEAGSNRFSLDIAPDDIDQISSEQPLTLKSNQAIAKDESLLVCYKDAATGLYVPNGFGYKVRGGAELKLIKVPDGAQPGAKDLFGAVQMLVFKFAGKIGFENPYPLLRAAWVNDDGLAEYDNGEVTQLRDKVKQAQRILLLVHGFTGDTRFMVVGQSVLKSVQAGFVDYDLVLTYDYESINTTIQDSARQLKAKLAQIGLGPDHGKTVHLVAHSLGTQVSRWFVEQEGGNKIVEQVVLLGPPNNGTSLAVVQKWLTYLVGLGLNGLLSAVSPALALAKLVHALSVVVGGVEKIDTTLDQLEPNSEFYQGLNGSPDPQVPYHVIIGDTSKVNGKGESVTLLQRLYPSISLLFAGQPNDIAISVNSAQTVATLDRTPSPSVRVVACDHLSYFSIKSSIKEIAKALASGE